MAKKGFGKFVAFAAISGAVAAGVSYVLQFSYQPLPLPTTPSV